MVLRFQLPMMQLLSLVHVSLLFRGILLGSKSLPLVGSIFCTIPMLLASRIHEWKHTVQFFCMRGAFGTTTAQTFGLLQFEIQWQFRGMLDTHADAVTRTAAIERLLASRKIRTLDNPQQETKEDTDSESAFVQLPSLSPPDLKKSSQVSSKSKSSFLLTSAAKNPRVQSRAGMSREQLDELAGKYGVD